MALRRYVMTAKRKAVLRKAQIASARKRKGKGRGKAVRNAAIAGGVAALAGTAAYGGYRNSKGYKARKIDKIVEKRWGVKGSEVSGVRLPDLNKPSNPVMSRAQIRREEAIRRMGQKPEYQMIPSEIDEQIFERASYVLRDGRDGRKFRGPHTGYEIRRAKRNQWNWKGNDSHKNISTHEAMRRTSDYERRMAAKGLKVSQLHRQRVMDRYSQMKGLYY